MANKTYAEALLRDVYLPRIIKLERENTVLSARLIRTARDIRGAKVISPTMVQEEQGVGNRDRGGDLPTASDAEFVYAEATLKHAYGALTLYGQDRIMSEGNSNEAIASILSTKVESLGNSFATDINRQFWGDGTGKLCKVTQTNTGTTQTVDNVQYLRLGMLVNNNVGTPPTSVYIKKIEPLTNVITVSASVTWTVDDLIYRIGNKDKEISGILTMVQDTGTYLGVSRTDYPEWRSLLINYQANKLDIKILDELICRLISERDSIPSVLYTDEQTVRWIKYIYQQQGIPLDYMNIQLGYRAMSYVHPKGTIPIVIEPYCPKGYIYPLDERYITVRQPKPIHWMPGYDGNYWRVKEGYDYEVAHLRYYFEMFNINPKTCGLLYNYTTPIV